MSHLCIIQFSLDREVVSLAHRTRTNILVESQRDFAVSGKYAIRWIRIANHLWASHILIEGNDLRRLRHLFTTEVAHRNGTDIPLSIRISIIVCHTEDIIECTFIRQQALVLISSRFFLADYPLFHGKPLRIALLLYLQANALHATSILIIIADGKMHRSTRLQIDGTLS